MLGLGLGLGLDTVGLVNITAHNFVLRTVGLSRIVSEVKGDNCQNFPTNALCGFPLKFCNGMGRKKME